MGIPKSNRGRKVVHGHTVGHNISPTYRTWRSMIARCYYPTEAAYPDYGAKGVRICDRWRHDFVAFLADMGPRPPACSIDRIDNTKGYEPGNCRWADKYTQARNRRTPVRQARTHCKRGHEFTAENTRMSRGYRTCRACAREHWRRTYIPTPRVARPPKPPKAPKQLATHCIYGHAFTSDNLLGNPDGYRRCRACHNARKRRYRAGKSVLPNEH
jgi:hypothetical protein